MVTGGGRRDGANTVSIQRGYKLPSGGTYNDGFEGFFGMDAEHRFEAPHPPGGNLFLGSTCRKSFVINDLRIIRK